MLPPQFGTNPTGQRLQRIKQSPHYRNGKFQNLNPTRTLAEGYSYPKVMYEYLLKKKPDVKPLNNMPVVQTDLRLLPAAEDVLVWFGHSSYLLQLCGKRLLVDPVLSSYASPFRGINKAFNGTSVYQPADMPAIDILLITHDHYDHLDYPTIQAIKDKVGMVICALGVGAHLERWGLAPGKIVEKDWWDNVPVEGGLTIHLTPARHFSGRGLKRDQTLWTSFVVDTSSKKFFLGGDSGYDTHFAEIGERFGSFDLAILDNGQYNLAWHQIHTLPNEVILAARDLNAQRVLPVHSGKFDLGGHPWYEPLQKVTQLAAEAALPLVTPKMGEVVWLNDASQPFANWWEGVR